MPRMWAALQAAPMAGWSSVRWPEWAHILHYIHDTVALSAADHDLVLAAARPTATGVVFDHPERVRGVVLSAYGVAVLVNDGPGFDF